MTQDEAFLRAILDEPESDALRLIYADWLEERGDARGEFVRVQVERATLDANGGGHEKRFKNDKRWCRLRDRERELWERKDANGDWLIRDVLPQPAHILIPQNGLADAQRPSLPMVIFRRGFGDEFRGAAEAFLRHAGALFQAAPIIRVVLSDKEPSEFELLHSNGRFMWQWYEEDGLNPTYRLPRLLFNAVERTGLHRDSFVGPERNLYYGDKDTALEALSRGCVEYGRSFRKELAATA